VIPDDEIGVVAPSTAPASSTTKYPVDTADDTFHEMVVGDPATKAPWFGDVIVGIVVLRLALVRSTTKRSLRRTSSQRPRPLTDTLRVWCFTAKRWACPCTTS
jgi:hypothetical protein